MKADNDQSQGSGNSVVSTLRVTVRLVVLAWLFVCAVFAVFVWVWSSPPFDRRFNEKVWKSQQGVMSPENPRWSMRHDLKRHHLKQGMTQNEVADLLGEPEKKRGSLEWCYCLGAYSGFRIDYDYLHVYFDPSQCLSDTQVRQH